MAYNNSLFYLRAEHINIVGALVRKIMHVIAICSTKKKLGGTSLSVSPSIITFPTESALTRKDKIKKLLSMCVLPLNLM